MSSNASPAEPGGGPVLPARPTDSARPVRADELRASHEDRDSVVERLRVAAGDGRLTAEELDERLEVALTARTYGELAALTADLPAAPGGGGPLAVGPGGLPEPKDLVRIQRGSAHVKRDARWAYGGERGQRKRETGLHPGGSHRPGRCGSTPMCTAAT